MRTLKTVMLISALSLANLLQAQSTTVTPATTTIVAPKTTATTSQDNFAERFITKSTQVIEKASHSIGGILEKYGNMMQVSSSSLTNVVLYQFIDEWYGTKYRLGGTNKKGIDCSAWVQKVYTFVYGMDMLRTSIMQFRSSEYIATKDNLVEGDLVFFRIHGGPVSHVGVYLKNNYFVHASSSKGIMISNLNENYWTRYYVGGGRVR
jgi:cell wall-associated NlpC family hydrolase